MLQGRSSKHPSRPHFTCLPAPCSPTPSARRTPFPVALAQSSLAQALDCHVLEWLAHPAPALCPTAPREPASPINLQRPAQHMLRPLALGAHVLGYPLPASHHPLSPHLLCQLWGITCQAARVCPRSSPSDVCLRPPENWALIFWRLCFCHTFPLHHNLFHAVHSEPDTSGELILDYVLPCNSSADYRFCH